MKKTLLIPVALLLLSCSKKEKNSVSVDRGYLMSVYMMGHVKGQNSILKNDIEVNLNEKIDSEINLKKYEVKDSIEYSKQIDRIFESQK